MIKINKLFPLFILTMLGGCGVLKNDTNYNNIPDGEYRSLVFSKGKLYVRNSNDSIIAHRLQKVKGDFIADTVQPYIKNFLKRSNKQEKSSFFHSTTFDVDALTIPFKYRPETRSLPQQFTTSLNGALFLGVRKDFYKLRYKKHFFRYYERESSHFAVSVGGFTGFGSTAMNPWVTNYNISAEYEGVVWLKGAAVIMALGKYTTGVSVAWDNLLDKNKKFWIYERKPWIGLVFGLNLN